MVFKLKFNLGMAAGKHLTCHVTKMSPQICPDHMKAQISSTIIFIVQLAFSVNFITFPTALLYTTDDGKRLAKTCIV